MEPVTEEERVNFDNADVRSNHQMVSRAEKEAPPKPRRSLLIVGVLIDVFLASLGAFGILIYRKLGSGVLTKTGFHCGDESLAYPYHHSTIPSWLNGAVGVLVPAIIIVADFLVKAAKKQRLSRKSVGVTLLEIFPTLICFLAGEQIVGVLLLPDQLQCLTLTVYNKSLVTMMHL